MTFVLSVLCCRKDSTWIPAGKPVIHKPVNLTVENKENVSSTVIRYNVTATGWLHAYITEYIFMNKYLAVTYSKQRIIIVLS